MIGKKSMRKPTSMVDAEAALPGRHEAMPITNRHYILGTPMQDNFSDRFAQIILGLGCFWGAEKLFWSLPGVYTTAAGYAGGFTPNPSYEEVCSGQTGHTEVVLVVYDPNLLTLDTLLRSFWQEHDPTQGMRQGNDIGTQYRSAIYVNNETDLEQALASKVNYQQQLNHSGFPAISTQIKIDDRFYYAEDYHQQYLGKNPNGYCGLRGTGVEF